MKVGPGSRIPPDSAQGCGANPVWVGVGSSYHEAKDAADTAVHFLPPACFKRPK